jgi:hypothetical protein
VTDFISIPSRLNQLWPWFNAVCSWDWGEPVPLAELIRSEPVPDEFRQAVADIVVGKRKRKRNWQKGLIPAAERMQIAGSVSLIVDLCRIIRTETVEGLEGISNRLGNVDPIDIVRTCEATARRAQLEAADQLGVSVETIENLLREMRARIDRWPVV